jgi:hypothetical protein
VREIRFLHPDLAAERSCDLGKGTIHNGERHGFLVRPGEQWGAEWTLACMWWQAHYWGRPDRKTERHIALVRGIVAGHDDQTLRPLMRSLWNDKGGLGRQKFHGAG